jgi:hypothetical protein
VDRVVGRVNVVLATVLDRFRHVDSVEVVMVMVVMVVVDSTWSAMVVMVVCYDVMVVATVIIYMY